jgi:uncharacterized coiled-coil protein SlyX
MATIDDVYNLLRTQTGRIEALEKKVALQATEISKLTAQLRAEQLRGERA